MDEYTQKKLIAERDALLVSNAELVEALCIAGNALDHCTRPAPGMSAVGFIAGRKATAAALKTARAALANATPTKEKADAQR